MGRLARVLAATLVFCAALAVPSTTAIASGSGETTDLGSIDVTIRDERVHVSDVEIEGESLPATEIDRREITIDAASVQVDGVTIDYGDTTYEIARVDVEIRDVGVVLEDVSIGNGG